MRAIHVSDKELALKLMHDAQDEQRGIVDRFQLVIRAYEGLAECKGAGSPELATIRGRLTEIGTGAIVTPTRPEDTQLLQRALAYLEARLHACAVDKTAHDAVSRAVSPRLAAPPESFDVEVPADGAHLGTALRLKLRELRDSFYAELRGLTDAGDRFGRYAYLVAKTMPKPDDPDDLNALAIQALLTWSPPLPGIPTAQRKQFGVIYIPIEPDAAVKAGEWKSYARGYGLTVAQQLMTRGCQSYCERADRTGPFVLLTVQPISDRASTPAAIFDLSGTQPSLVSDFIRDLRGLLAEGRTWRGADTPGDTLRVVRNALARLGHFVIEVSESVASVKAVVTPVLTPLASPGEGH